MIKGIELLKVDNGFGVTHPQGAFHHATGHGDPLRAAEKRGEKPPHGVVSTLHIGGLRCGTVGNGAVGHLVTSRHLPGQKLYDR